MSLFQELQEYLLSAGKQVYLVGGFVRDALLGRDTRDIDLAVEGDPLLLARSLADRLGGSYVTLDPERGVARAVIHQKEEGWLVDVSAIQGEGILQDLARRDFTVDAMAVELAASRGSPETWPLLDPFQGRHDLEQRLLRALQDRVFQDDPVRLLRAPRLAAQAGLTIEPHTLDLILRDAMALLQAAPERVRDELLKTLACPRVGDSLRLIDSLGLLEMVIPELAQGRGISQPKEHYWDVFDHNIETAAAVERVLGMKAQDPEFIQAAIPWDDWAEGYFQEEASDGHSRATLLKVAALLHDVAKPATKTVEPSGRIRFLGHHKKGALMAEAILRRLRFSGRGVARVRTMIEHHMRPNLMAQRGQLPTARAIYRFFRDAEEVTMDTLYLCLADYLAARGPYLEREEWECQCQLIDHILKTGLARSPQTMPRLVDGDDLVQLFGLVPSPRFRTILEAVREAQGAGEVSSREEALRLIRRLLEENPQVVGEPYAQT